MFKAFPFDFGVFSDLELGEYEGLSYVVNVLAWFYPVLTFPFDS